jgi:cation transporter-like permease
MSDEFGNWNELARLWHTHSQTTSALHLEKHERRRRRQMRAVAAAEAVSMVLSFIASVWIAMQTAMIALTAISVVFFALCGFLQHRLRLEPDSVGGFDLLSSLQHGVMREMWILRQLAIGRVISALTLFAIAIMTADHVLHPGTPLSRLMALFSVLIIVAGVLIWNLWLTAKARSRLQRLDMFANQMSRGPEFRDGNDA